LIDLFKKSSTSSLLLVNNLDNYGCPVIKGLPTPKECRELSSLYDHDEH